MDLKAGEAEPLQMRHERAAASKAPLRLRQECDGGQPVIAHVIERGPVDDVIVPVGPQKLQEIQPGLRMRKIIESARPFSSKMHRRFHRRCTPIFMKVHTQGAVLRTHAGVDFGI